MKYMLKILKTRFNGSTTLVDVRIFHQSWSGSYLFILARFWISLELCMSFCPNRRARGHKPTIDEAWTSYLAVPQVLPFTVYHYLWITHHNFCPTQFMDPRVMTESWRTGDILAMQAENYWHWSFILSNIGPISMYSFPARALET